MSIASRWFVISKDDGYEISENLDGWDGADEHGPVVAAVGTKELAEKWVKLRGDGRPIIRCPNCGHIHDKMRCHCGETFEVK